MMTFGLMLSAFKADSNSSWECPLTVYVSHPKLSHLRFTGSKRVRFSVSPSMILRLRSSMTVKLSRLLWDANKADSHTDPSYISPSLKITNVRAGFLSRFAAIQYPQAIPTPCPSDPVEIGRAHV